MKTLFVRICIYIFKKAAGCVYFFLKGFPVRKHKILFCSRQSNDVPLDFMLIEREIRNEIPEAECVNICCHMGHKVSGYVRYMWYFTKSLYHLATSHICILDSYWPAVSLLKHKKNLKVIQIWHAIGKIKQSGYQTLGKKSGRNAEYARALNMHGNYDYVIAGAKFWNQYYCRSFGIKKDKILNYGLPRIDYLINTEKKNRENFFSRYPVLKNRKIILYAPTFRRNMRSHWEEILDVIDDGYALIVKKHPGEYAHSPKQHKNVFYMDEFKTIELMAVCDYFITDYSAGALEAAVLKKKTYYWTYDYEDYVRNNGLNIELDKEAAPYVFTDIRKLMDSIRSGKYDESFMERYREKFLPEELGNSTEKIVKLIKDMI